MSNEEKAQFVACEIKKSIKNKTYPYGTSIPSERELATIFNTNRSIIRNAIDYLIDEKMLKRVQGKGTYVIKTDIDDSSIHFKGMSELLMKAGFEPSSKVLKTQIRRAGYRFSKIFNVDEKTDIFQIIRLRLGNETPISIENTYILYDSIANVEDIDFQIYSLYDVFAINHIHIHNIQHAFSTTRVHNTLAKLLEKPDAQTVVSINITSTTTEHQIAEYTEVLVAPEFCKYYTDGIVKNGIFNLNSQLV